MAGLKIWKKWIFDDSLVQNMILNCNRTQIIIIMDIWFT